MTRRGFLQAGTLGIAGLTLADLLKAEDRASGKRPKSVVMINLAGGISPFETWDMKPDAPQEIRGTFTPISTVVPGLQFSHMLPEQAKVADKMAILRGVRATGQHGSHEFLTGWSYYPKQENTFGLRRPSVGAVASYALGGHRGIPPYVALREQGHDDDPAQLGPAHRPLFCFQGFQQTQPAAGLTLIDGLSIDRLQERGELVRAMDQTRRLVDNRGEADAYDAYQRRAMELLTSDKIARALNFREEPKEVLERWGRPDKNSRDFHAGSLLTARRLVEAGVRVATIHFPGWDTHSKNFTSLESKLPTFDQAVAAFITDIHERGLQDDVLLVLGGEMGRTPKINAAAGRDHWPQTAVYVFAGGGMNMGQAIGSTDRNGAEPTGEVMTPKNVVSTIYRFLGVDVNQTLHDPLGRPFELLDDTRPVRSLVS